MKSNIHTKGVRIRGLIKASILTYKLTLLQYDVYDLYGCVLFRSHINFFQHQLCNPFLVGIKVKSEDQTGNVKLNVSGNFYSA